MSKRLCIDCKTRKAEVPDRYAVGRPIKRRCYECHAALLREDLRRVADSWVKHTKEDDHA